MKLMRRCLPALMGATLLVFGGAGGPGSVTAASPARVTVGYYASDDVSDLGFYPKSIPTGDYTHINYAFARPTAGGACALFAPDVDYKARVGASHSVTGVQDGANQKLRGNFNQLKQLKAANPGLKVLISVGGWTLSKYFSDIAATSAMRTSFARSCVGMFLKGNLPVSGSQGGSGVAKGVFDGIDIDWEFPVSGGLGGNHHRAADRHNATLLFKELRRQMDAYGQTTGRHYLLTAAMPSGNEANQKYELAAVATPLDWMNAMAYDMHGSWESTTDFTSPFKLDPADPQGSTALTARGTVTYFRQYVPASKLVLGVPFYGLQYTGVTNANHGLYQHFTNAGLNGSGNWTTVANPTYRDLVDGGAAAGGGGWTKYRSPSGNAYLWNPTLHGGSFVGYDDAYAVQLRVDYAKSKDIRGLMTWEISNDDASYTLSDTLSSFLVP